MPECIKLGSATTQSEVRHASVTTYKDVIRTTRKPSNFCSEQT